MVITKIVRTNIKGFPTLEQFAETANVSVETVKRNSLAFKQMLNTEHFNKNKNL